MSHTSWSSPLWGKRGTGPCVTRHGAVHFGKRGEQVHASHVMEQSTLGKEGNRYTRHTSWSSPLWGKRGTGTCVTRHGAVHFGERGEQVHASHVMEQSTLGKEGNRSMRHTSWSSPLWGKRGTGTCVTRHGAVHFGERGEQVHASHVMEQSTLGQEGNRLHASHVKEQSTLGKEVNRYMRYTS